jgi:hypothetical protein
VWALGTSVSSGDQCGSRPPETSVCARVGNVVPATMWSSWVGAGPVEWSMDPGLTASVEGSPRPADGVFWPRGSGSISAHGGVYGNLGWCPGKSCARSRSPRSEIRARGEDSFAEGKVFTKVKFTESHGIGRRIVAERKWAWKGGFLGGYGSWRAEDWYKGLAPACCIFSLQHT